MCPVLHQNALSTQKHKAQSKSLNLFPTLDKLRVLFYFTISEAQRWVLPGGLHGELYERLQQTLTDSALSSKGY